MANAGSGTATLNLGGFNTVVKSVSFNGVSAGLMAAGPTSQGTINLTMPRWR